LCGEVHRLRIHALLVRKIRTREEQNTEILIVSIYCLLARKQGKQYTKRILPPFVIFRCVIILENVLRYVSKHSESERIDYEEASYLLGSYDDRTIRKHIETAWRMIREAKLDLSRLLAGLGMSAGLSEAETPLSEWQQIEQRSVQGSKEAGHTPDTESCAFEPIVVIHAAYERLGRGRDCRERGPPH